MPHEVHDVFDKREISRVPPAVLARALELFDRVKGQPKKLGESDLVAGVWIETHTLGCRNAAGEPEENWWASHWQIFDDYQNDGVSIIGGDPADGAFVSLTPSHKKAKS
jgi:hypothetical protein